MFSQHLNIYKHVRTPPVVKAVSDCLIPLTQMAVETQEPLVLT
jgi:hypothetical protein